MMYAFCSRQYSKSHLWHYNSLLMDIILRLFSTWAHKLNGLIICPYWPSQPWYSRLLELLIDFPILFSEENIRDPSQMLPKSCRFLAWPIGCNHARKLDFQKKLQNAPLGVSPKIPWLLTKNAGESSVVGVVRGKLVTIRLI